ncbi:MAG: type II secretion system protein [Phycisphaerales bacterium]
MVKTPRHAFRRGVALIDAIVASIILGVALSAIIGLGSQAVNSQRLGEQLQTAAMLADEQLNLVLARGPDDYGKRFGGLAGICDEPFSEYRYQLTFVGGSGGAPYTVSATILWEAGGRERSIAIETMIAPRLGEEIDPDRRPLTPVERIPGT